jgi:hypothetical protein
MPPWRPSSESGNAHRSSSSSITMGDRQLLALACEEGASQVKEVPWGEGIGGRRAEVETVRGIRKPLLPSIARSPPGAID